VILLGTGPAFAQATSNFDLMDTTPDAGLPNSVGGQSAQVLSAFHGLDALPLLARLICRGARGKAGMPVFFATEIDLTTLQAGDFKVTTQSGNTGEMHCVSVLPATDPGELRTVLLIGDLGPAEIDPPVRVEIVGHLHSIDGRLDYQGAAVDVIPLMDGPSLTYAERVEDWTRVGTLGPHRARGSLCPDAGTVQAVRVTWQGGVTLESGSDLAATDGALYTLTIEGADGARRSVSPFAIADLGDGDNNHMLCLDTTDRPVSVSFPPGILTDPNTDLNPATQVSVSR